ncbi:carboxypeptidase-like regulatory domain-containing protein [Paludisphaera rhizosphaerae]|uniref:carboxypeptidase-like regulatory domain-containing protein n=1 Tax=Paludisphaera rhizosphaerae TaxID=2711216 RepID=UPI0013EA6BB8|nr:carboxypeptidase-like regulatory domain-containing protein [Paludisphaera rhizosphaerae]
MHESNGGGPTFTLPPQNDLTWIIIDAADYAPGLIGPLKSEDLKPDDPPVDVVLQEGFPHRVRVVDAEGSPISGASVHAGLTITPPSDHPAVDPNQQGAFDSIAGPLRTLISTDADGWAVIPHVRSETDYEFAVTVYNCMLPDDTVFVRPEPGIDTVIKLPRSATTGIVVDEEGRPSADALVLIASEFDEINRQESAHPLERIFAAKTDSQGKFRLPNLHRDSSYLIRVEGADGSLGFAGGVRASDSEIRVETLRRRILRGVLVGDRRTVVTLVYTIPTGFEGRRSETGEDSVIHWTVTVSVTPDGHFEFPVWDPSHVELKVGGQPAEIPWPPPSAPVEFEGPRISQPTEREVRLRVEVEETGQAVDGTLTLTLMNGPPERRLQSVPRLVEIRNGAASFTCLRNEVFQYGNAAIPGYWTIPGTIFPTLSDSPHPSIVRTVPARPIRGRVVDSNGSPVGAGVKVSIAEARMTAPVSQPDRNGNPPDVQSPRASPSFEVPGQPAGPAAAAPPPASPDSGASMNVSSISKFLPRGSATTDAEGTFMIDAWPIDFPGRISVACGCAEGAVAPVYVRASGLPPEVKVELPRTTTATIHLLDADGRPLSSAPVIVGLTRNSERNEWAVGSTDIDGKAVIDGLAVDEQGYDLSIRFANDYQRITVPLKLGGPPLELKAQRGRVLEGRVVETVTGWPIPQANIEVQSTSDGRVHAQTRTDEDGRFRVSTLSEGTYKVLLGPAFALRNPSTSWLVAEAGTGQPIEIRVANLNQLAPQPKRPTRP